MVTVNGLLVLNPSGEMSHVYVCTDVSTGLLKCTLYQSTLGHKSVIDFVIVMC